MQTRRWFLKTSAAAGAAALMPWEKLWAQSPLAAPLPGGTLPPTSIPKYVTPLVIPPPMPPTANPLLPSIDYYEIAMRQFRQQILPSSLPQTTVWSYGSANHPATLNYPAFTIEAAWNRPVRVKWINGLVNGGGQYLPHLLAVDQTLHWANPPGGLSGRDTAPGFGATPGPYTGPVPMVTHLHGAIGVGDESDGYTQAWYLPAATNLPTGYARVGTNYDVFKASALARFGATWDAGSATFQYPNDQRDTTMWYHDHALGMTRLNVYAGPAGFYLLRGSPAETVRDRRNGAAAVLPGPAPALNDPAGRRYYEIPLAIQDRSFNADGSLFYPNSRAFFDGVAGPYIPGSDIPPQWNPEFFGNVMVVNGKTWPYLQAEKRRYRFRLLNGCNSRFLLLHFDIPNVQVWQIGNEGGFLPAPVNMNANLLSGFRNAVLLAPAERADVIVDFTAVAPGSYTLLNKGPDSPFGGLSAPAANTATTGQVMQFRVVNATSADTSTPPQYLQLPAITALTGGARRPLALFEMMSMNFPGAPAMAMLGTMNTATGVPQPRLWGDPITESPAVGATEVWEFFNFTADAHPIHLHEVHFQVVDRQKLKKGFPSGKSLPPQPWELGYKDTVIAYPGEITRVRARFAKAGLFVWHCHIVEHEDNEMMRPLRIGP